jgi:hypothetical protein
MKKRKNGTRSIDLNEALVDAINGTAAIFEIDKSKVLSIWFYAHTHFYAAVLESLSGEEDKLRRARKVTPRSVKWRREY